MMSNNIRIDDLVEFTEHCQQLGVAKCRANKTAGKVMAIMEGKYKSYLVDAGLGYWVHVGPNDIKPFSCSVKKDEVRLDKVEATCKV